MLFCITTPPKRVLIQQTKCYAVIPLKQPPEGGQHLQHFFILLDIIELDTFTIAKDLGMTPGNKHPFFLLY